MRIEISELKTSQVNHKLEEKIELKADRQIPNISFAVNKVTITPTHETHEKKSTEEESKSPMPKKTSLPLSIKPDTEKFIGENLINKIGIIITVIGVAFGTKYSVLLFLYKEAYRQP